MSGFPLLPVGMAALNPECRYFFVGSTSSSFAMIFCAKYVCALAFSSGYFSHSFSERLHLFVGKHSLYCTILMACKYKFVER